MPSSSVEVPGIMDNCNSSASSGDSGHGDGSGDTGGLMRKYMVLLHDSMAIKFVNELEEKPFLEDGQKAEDTSGVGIKLYKSFQEANLKCYWNPVLCEAVRHLEYKGYIIPSTILVGSRPQFLSVVRTAWARKMLRNPLGFRIQFIGEIEEVVAEPVAQGQFAPLSDSLCWAIMELSSSGEEAFVDTILFSLAKAFPLMSLPPRELVYQTLERLIRERKVYQTSQGYFIVTPDTFRYMNSGGEYDIYGRTGFLDDDDYIITDGTLKRHNSLKVIRQRDLDVLTPSMGARSLSFRLSKTKPVLGDSSEVESSTSPVSSPETTPTTLAVKTGEKKAKKPSIFRRWFSFRRRSSSMSNVNNNKGPTNLTPVSRISTLPNRNNKPPLQFQSVNSQTGTALLKEAHNPSLNNENPKYSDSLPSIRHLPQRSFENMLEAEADIGLPTSHRPVPLSKWGSLPSSGRRSRRSIINDSPFYDVLDPRTQSLSNRSRASSSFGYGTMSMYSHTPQSQSSRKSSADAIEQGKDIRVDPASATRSQSRPRSRVDSPSPSVSAIYASIGGTGSKQQIHQGLPPVPVSVTMRPRPNHHGSRYPWRPRSAYELLAYQRNAMTNNTISHKQIPIVQRKYSQPNNVSTVSTVRNVGSNNNVTTTSTITSRYSTQLQVQIPIPIQGKLVGKKPALGNRQGGNGQGDITVQVKTQHGDNADNGRLDPILYQNKDPQEQIANNDRSPIEVEVH